MSEDQEARTTKSPKVLARLALSADFLVRYEVARNPATSQSTRNLLFKDPDEDVRLTAKRYSKKR